MMQSVYSYSVYSVPLEYVYNPECNIDASLLLKPRLVTLYMSSHATLSHQTQYDLQILKHCPIIGSL